MIRLAQDDGWILVTHPNHAQLAGAFAEHWNNESFLAPEPRASVLHGVAHHDDAWTERDAEPLLTREGLPSAFSKELVGTYDSFEEIDMEEYVGIRGQAAKLVADADPYAAILISMHTHNLLSEHVDPETITPDQAKVLETFLEEQTKLRQSWVDAVAEDPDQAVYAQSQQLDAGFRFLQACDSLSLITCVAYENPIPLQHMHLSRQGESVEILCTPLGNHTYRLEPYPMDEDELQFSLPYKFVPGSALESLERFQEAYANAPDEALTVTITR